MKKLEIPKPKNIVYVADEVQKTLDILLGRRRREGREIITLYGAYKFTRTSKLHAGLGDYVILSQCVEWMRKNNQKFTELEIKRCLRYFVDYNYRKTKLNNSLIKNLTTP